MPFNRKSIGSAARAGKQVNGFADNVAWPLVFGRIARRTTIALPVLVLTSTSPAFAQDIGLDESAPEVSPHATIRFYGVEDFIRFAPKNAADMLRQVPGFVIRSGSTDRGLGQASENILINMQRVVSKSGGAIAQLERVSASSVVRIEILDAASLNIAGLTGQVANIVVKSEGGRSGQFSWRPEFRAHYTDPILTRGDISFAGKVGPIDYTLALNSNGSRSGAGGKTTISRGDGSLLETRDDVWRSNYDNPTVSAQLAYGSSISAQANLAMSFTPYWNDYRETSVRTAHDGSEHVRSLTDRTEGFEYEINGDYSIPLGPGRIKVIGLRSFDHEPVKSTATIAYPDGAPGTGDKISRDGKLGEWIGRAEYSWRTGENEFQVTAEGAFNRLHSETRVFRLMADGNYEEVPFPQGTGSVDEKRYEVLGTWGRAISDQLQLQAVLGGEYSTLSSESSLGSSVQRFFRPKGSVSLSWRTSENFDASLKIARKVGQLDFYDFLASVNLNEQTENAGNLDLVPPQSWDLDLESNRKLGEWGTTTFRIYGSFINDIVDIVPVGDTGESPGNIDRAIRYGAEWKSTFLFDPIGWKGAKLDTIVGFERSRLRDPLTGEDRQISQNLRRNIELIFRHDLPQSPWAWGSSFYHNRYAKNYRLTEVGRAWEGPLWLSAYIEHKDVAGLTVRATVGNILGARSRWDRTVFDGYRNASPILFVEKRNRSIGPIFALSVRGDF